MLTRTIIVAILGAVVLADELTLPSTIPSTSLQQLKDALKEQCKKAGAEDKVADVENAGKLFVDCIKGLFDADTLKKEIDEARPNGALDEVFKKYCAKSAQLKTCIRNVLDGVSPCVEPAQREHFTDINNGASQLIDFVCYKDGDRIALFIAEGGPECFQSKADDLKTCAETLKNSYSSIEEAKALTTEQRCAKYDQLVSCIVQKLETCSTPTPSNMFESLAKFVRNSSPCAKPK